VGVLGESVRPPRCAMALTAGGGGTGIFVHGQRTRALGHGGAGCAAQSSGGLLLVVGTGQDRLRKYARVGDKEARSACGYHRDVERNFHIAVQKGSINFVTKGGRAYRLNVERQRPYLRIVSCLMRTLDYHSSNDIYTTCSHYYRDTLHSVLADINVTRVRRSGLITSSRRV